jgi:hypothetical protein
LRLITSDSKKPYVLQLSAKVAVNIAKNNAGSSPALFLPNPLFSLITVRETAAQSPQN